MTSLVAAVSWNKISEVSQVEAHKNGDGMMASAEFSHVGENSRPSWEAHIIACYCIVCLEYRRKSQILFGMLQLDVPIIPEYSGCIKLQDRLSA